MKKSLLLEVPFRLRIGREVREQDAFQKCKYKKKGIGLYCRSPESLQVPYKHNVSQRPHTADVKFICYLYSQATKRRPATDTEHQR